MFFSIKIIFAKCILANIIVSIFTRSILHAYFDSWNLKYTLTFAIGVIKISDHLFYFCLWALGNVTRLCWKLTFPSSSSSSYVDPFISRCENNVDLIANLYLRKYDARSTFVVSNTWWYFTSMALILYWQTINQSPFTQIVCIHK